MSNINFAQINIEGRLTDDPEIKPAKDGSTYCTFRVAVNRRTKDGEKTSFIPVIVFGKDAINCGEYLSKGRSVMVSGDFETDNYEDRDGNKRTGFSVRAHNVIFGSGGQKSNDDDVPRGSRDDDKPTYGSSKSKATSYLNKNRGRGYDQGR